MSAYNPLKRISGHSTEPEISSTEEQQQAKKMRSALTIGTHSGTFHADESLAVYMLRLLPKYADANLVRSRNPEELEKCDIIVDVSGKYDGVKYFDHHQREFDGVLGNGFNTKLSSAGLVYKHFGHQVLASILKVSEDSPVVQACYPYVYKQFVEAIDANDNGISAYDSQVISAINDDESIPYNISERFVNGNITIPSVVSRMNPLQYEIEESELEESKVYDLKFGLASQFMGNTFVDMVVSAGKGWYPSKEKMEKAFAAREDPRIIIMDELFNWKSHLYDIEKGLIAKEGKLTDDNKVIYVIYAGGDSWRVQAVAVSPSSFVSRKPLPESWRGFRDEELSKISGIEGGVFVHASGFIGGNKTREGAIAMAKKALDL